MKRCFLLTVAVQSLAIAIPTVAAEGKLIQANLDIKSLSEIQLPAKSTKLLIQQDASTEVVPSFKIEQVAQTEKNQLTIDDTAPKPPKPALLNFTQECVRCEIRYSDNARQLSIEGSSEVAIDYDENGKVTNVRLTRSSGYSELDEALVEQARQFQLKPRTGGRKGMRVVVNFAIKRSDVPPVNTNRRRRTLTPFAPEPANKPGVDSSNPSP